MTFASSNIACSAYAQMHMHIASILGCPSTCSGPPSNAYFPFNTLAVAGVFGGDKALSAMAIIHVYEARRWLGWYNSPGSYQIAKLLRVLAQSKVSDSFSPDFHTDLAKFDSDISKRPKFRVTRSGTMIKETGLAATLFMKECVTRGGKVAGGEKTKAVGVMIAELHYTPEPQMYPRRINGHFSLSAIIPIAASVGTCVACHVSGDWCACLLILLGILARGVSCLVIGSAKFMFTRPRTPPGGHPGDGILCSGKDIVLLKGTEGAVNSITHGRFSLGFCSEHQYRNIRWCSHLLTIQFLAQLFLVLKCSLFGQIMFAVSLAVSWIYNFWLSSLDKERIQRDILFNSVLGKPVLTKFSLDTRTTAVVFILLVLQPKEPAKILDVLLPKDSKVWKEWKETVVRRLLNKETLEFVDTDWLSDEFTRQERTQLKTLYSDAQSVYDAYIEYAKASS